MPVQPKTDPRKSREEKRPVQPAPHGVGPLLQRDYVGVIAGSRLTPEEILWQIRMDFPRFSPKLLADFSRTDEQESPLELGDTMHIFLPGTGHCAVVVAHLEPRSLTLRTLKGHIEAGMITFGADYDEAARIMFRIRSRARIDQPVRFMGYWMGGMRMQTTIWATYVRRVAEASGGRLLGGVHCSTDRTEERPVDRAVVDHPTFEVDEDVPEAALAWGG
jgi:hypothetical protein